MIAQPSWAAFFVEWQHPAAVIFSVAFPLLRAIVRKLNQNLPCFTHGNVIQDFAHGLVFPTFAGMILLPMHPGLLQSLDSHAMQFAGGLAICQVIKEILKPEILQRQ
jgi:hypothetical protein